MSDQPRYVDEDGNPVDPGSLDEYETVPAPAAAGPAARPATPVGAPAPARGGTGPKLLGAVVVTALVLGAAGVGAYKAGWIAPGSTVAAAPSATATSSEPSSAAATTSASASSSAPSSTSENTAPVAVDSSRYTGAKWPSTALSAPSVRLRVTDSVKLPSSSGLWNANVSQAFDRFAPWCDIAATAPGRITVQTVGRAAVTKPWAESTVDVTGAPKVVGENSGENVDDSSELVNVDGSPEGDTGPDSGKPVTYRVEGGDVPVAAKGKRKNSVKVSVIKRDGATKDVVWLVAGGVLMRAVVEEVGGSSEPSADEGTEAKDTEGN
ncbi:hypothetical protein [Tsukamurella sp. USMM236]|uniref:hypothetical protein n=1 Tax=Tsukamurella sp. USMM236 TaxID=3081301 RepID=UPI00301A5FEF